MSGGTPGVRGAGPNAPQLADYLPHRSLLHLLGVLLLVIAPHLVRLPWWESAATIGLIVWRGYASARQWQLPPQTLKVGLAVAAFGLVYWTYGRISGQYAGVALLVLMLALKLTEMRSRRDVMVTVFLMYFLLITHFLFSQELWTIVYLLVSATAITAVLVDAHHPGDPLSAREALRIGGTMIAQALPLMVLFFILFPRIPGPIWGLPNDAGSARSGLSETMSPGDISHLVESDEPAFRVKFDGPAPPVDRRYWRGPVFENLDSEDGRTWRPRGQIERVSPAVIDPQGATTTYEITLEPMRSRWLFLLDAADPLQLPQGAYVDTTGSVMWPSDIRERKLIRATSKLRYVLEPVLAPRARERNLRLPEGYNPRTLELGQEWRGKGMSDSEIVDAALHMFREQPFIYTLDPPELGRDTVDQFLFKTRRGFCEHFSAAFTVLMRSAGVPARVVTGYQGGLLNEFGGYYLVSQSDAHAWSEVWLDGRGWVRIDPTAAVAPGRIEGGLTRAVTAAEGLPAFLQRRNSLKVFFQVRWDWVNARWNEWVLAYGPDLQERFLSHFGMADTARMILGLTAGVSIGLMLIGLYTLRKANPPPVTEKALQLWREAGRRLRSIGFEQRPDEGPRDFARRVADAEPALAGPMLGILDAYLRLRYAGEKNPGLEKEFAAAVKQIRRP